MRLIFAGTPTFAAVVLQDLLQHHYHVVSVLTQPDSPAGRGLRSQYSPVKQVSLEHGIALHQPASLKSDAAQAALAAAQPDVLVVVAYGLILPPPVLSIPRLGCLNIHASLLPRWRGAAPIQRAIMAGDEETGICIMRMEVGLDTGPIYLCRRTPITAEDTAGSLHDRLATLGAHALRDVLIDLKGANVEPTPQAAEGVTYAAKILKADGRIDWSRPAAQIERLLRGLDPAPGAYTMCRGQQLKLWRGAGGPSSDDAPAGTVVAVSPEAIHIRCGVGVLSVSELQRPGGRRLSAGDFLRGFRLAVGDRLGD
jgi:methionyl-tRNA formyltransferase